MYKKLVNEFNFIENLHINNLLHTKHAEFKGMEQEETQRGNLLIS